MNTSKEAVRLIAKACAYMGIRHVVFSPGSRSAPLVIAFSHITEIECIVIPDERVAGYFALGMAQQLRSPVAIVCTSGTAVLNLSPAICEAYYQKVPLLVLTADRPEGAVERGENQAIHQEGIMQSFTCFEADVDGDAEGEERLRHVQMTLSRCFKGLVEHLQPARLNIRMSEPLYDHTTLDSSELKLSESLVDNFIRNHPTTDEPTALIGTEKKVMLLCGSQSPDEGFNKSISEIVRRANIVVLAESLGNIGHAEVIRNYDPCLHLLSESMADDYAPDVIITLGNSIVSKRIRNLIHQHPPIMHIDTIGDGRRDYFALSDMQPIFMSRERVLQRLQELPAMESGYRELWKNLSRKVQTLSEKYLAATPFSDLKVFETLIKSFPEGADVQYGNSTPIRYSNLFQHRNSLTVYSNRGTSGIDGCVSTAAGAAFVNKKLTVCVVGDVSFFYDSNALWNNYLSPFLRIIVINNGGGNIFRLIDGPQQISRFEKFFETEHNLTAKHLASMYGIPYYICDRQDDLGRILEKFYHPHDGKPVILEIKTNNELSADVYKKYFEYLKHNNG